MQLCKERVIFAKTSFIYKTLQYYAVCNALLTPLTNQNKFMQDLSFSVHSFAMCSPATGSIKSLNEATQVKWDSAIDEQSWVPDDGFMPKRKLRRLSRISKMALFSAHHASEQAEAVKIGAPIFCSRFGEFKNTTNVLKSIHDHELVSPMDFSYAVHNTAQGLYSILHNDTRPATALSAREGIVEEALVKAYAQLIKGDEAVLVVYQEDKLPDTYKKFERDRLIPLSFAIVVGKNDQRNKPTLKLSYRPKQTDEINKNYNEHEQNIARLFLNGGGEAPLQTKRMLWNWEYDTH